MRVRQYFYQKTRNYRVMLAAARTGGKYGLALGGATAVYVLLDESVGWAREDYFGVKEESPEARVDEVDMEDGTRRKKVSWRRGGVEWEDGAVAGGLLGAGVGTACEFCSGSAAQSRTDGARSTATTAVCEVHDDRDNAGRFIVCDTDCSRHDRATTGRGDKEGESGGETLGWRKSITVRPECARRGGGAAERMGGSESLDLWAVTRPGGMNAWTYI